MPAARGRRALASRREMADIYATAAARSRAWRRPSPPARARAATSASSRPRACPPRRACSTSAAARSACARSSPSSTSPASTSLERPSYPGPFVRADACEGLPFADREFDLVYCSSVIEHVAPARRAAFAAELRRVGRGWFVQTPAYSFPIEPHSLLPGAHWLPVRLRRRYWRLGATGGWEEISLLRRARGGGAVRRCPRRALRAARQELGRACASRVRRLMSLLTPLMTRNSSSTIPTEL